MISSDPSSPRRRLTTVAFPRSRGSTGGASRGGLSFLIGFSGLAFLSGPSGPGWSTAAVASCLFHPAPSQMKTMSFLTSTVTGMNFCFPVNWSMMGMNFLVGVLTPLNVTTWPTYLPGYWGPSDGGGLGADISVRTSISSLIILRSSCRVIFMINKYVS